MKHTGAYQVESGSSAVAIAISPNVLNIEVRTQLAFPGKMPPKGPQNVEFLLWELLKTPVRAEQVIHP